METGIVNGRIQFVSPVISADKENRKQPNVECENILPQRQMFAAI